MRAVFSPAVAAAVFAVASFASGGVAQANKEAVLHVFSGGADGGYPQSPPIVGRDGNLYGTTYQGGNGFGYGVVYKFTPSGAETVLYSFDDEIGYGPWGGVIRDQAGNLYGTTVYSSDGYGSVFRIGTDGKETVLYSFGPIRSGDGQRPESRLLQDRQGNFYGSTLIGGAVNFGTVFKLAPDGTETVLHSFAGGTDGEFPKVGLVMDGRGNLYGTTGGEGGDCAFGCGTVFRLSSKGKIAVLHAFTGGSDGATPDGNLILDAAGHLYGVASAGGGGRCSGGCGVVFRLAPDGTETVLHTFTGSEGAAPTGSLIMDRAGNLYGVAASGGAGNHGVVFKLAPDGTESVLHAFTGGAKDGASPVGVVMDKHGDLYGATSGGGTGCGGAGCGTLFKIRN